MSIFVQTCVAWFLVAWFLPKVKNTTKVTTQTWLFMILFSVATALQAKPIYEATNNWLRVNHMGWLISYLAGNIAFYAMYRALAIIQPAAPRQQRFFHYATIGLVICLSLIFPPIAREPVGANEVAPYNIWLLLFRIISYSYSLAVTFALTKMLYALSQQYGELHERVRWLLLAGSTGIATVYFTVRISFLTMTFFFPGVLPVLLVSGIPKILDALGIMRISWLFFFIPVGVYKFACRPLVFLNKLWTLPHLETLQQELAGLFPQLVRLDVTYYQQHYLRHLDFLQHYALVMILDGKRKLADEKVLTGDEARRQTVAAALAPVQDDGDFKSLVTAYRKIGKKHRSQFTSQPALWQMLTHVLRPCSLAGSEQQLGLQSIDYAHKIVDQLAFDFRQFTTTSFFQEVASIRKRKIWWFGLPMPLSMCGAWLRDTNYPYEYIFYNSKLPPLHQVYVQLHEIGHFLCGHETLSMTGDKLTILMNAVKHQAITPAVLEILTPVSPQKKEKEEAEAEAVMMVIQAHAVQASRTGELLYAVSNNNEADRFLYDMGLRV